MGDSKKPDFTCGSIRQALPPGSTSLPFPLLVDPRVQGLVGATILAIGLPPEEAGPVEGGGIAIDYIPEGKGNMRRLVIGHTELGWWVEADVELG